MFQHENPWLWEHATRVRNGGLDVGRLPALCRMQVVLHLRDRWGGLEPGAQTGIWLWLETSSVTVYTGTVLLEAEGAGGSVCPPSKKEYRDDPFHQVCRQITFDDVDIAKHSLLHLPLFCWFFKNFVWHLDLYLGWWGSQNNRSLLHYFFDIFSFLSLREQKINTGK